jgi:hypothetical protein
MTFSGIKRLARRSAVWLAAAVVMTVAIGASSDAWARRGTTKAYGSVADQTLTSQQKHVKLRYFGGPKSAMYSE